MIHELIEQKRKSHRSRTSKNAKILQDPKTFSHGFQETKVAPFEASDDENKEPESASAVFIPPWLRNSFRLNQKNNLNMDWTVCLPTFTALGQQKVGSDSKAARIVQRGKAQNGVQSLKLNLELDSSKKPAANLESLPQESFQSVSPGQDAAEGVDSRPDNSDKRIPIYWRLRRRESDSGSSCSNMESVKKNDSKITSGEALLSTDMERSKTEHRKKLKFFRTKDRTRKRAVADLRETELSKREIDFLLEFKARDSAKANGASESRHREPKFLLLGGKPHGTNAVELSKEKFRLLQEIRSQGGGEDDLEGVFEKVKETNYPASPRSSIPSPRNAAEKIGDKVEKKSSQEDNLRIDRDAVLSTDDENDIKRFSEFLSKNKNLDEKRKCLEEVRNYFERKRRTRMTKRCVLEDDRPRPSLRSDWKEDLIKEKSKQKDVYRRRRSKLTLDEETVEKAVDETLQRFLELYHLRMSPTSVVTMKKNIIEAIKADAGEGGSSKFCELKLPPAASKRAGADVPTRDTEKAVTAVFAEREVPDSPRRESRVYKDIKKKHFKNSESFGEPFSKASREGEAESAEDEKLRNFKEDLNSFLSSVQGRFDFASLKLQSLVLEKEDKTAVGKGVQLVYSFGKEVADSGRGELRSPHKIGLEVKARKDFQCQAAAEPEVCKKNARVGTVEQKSSCCDRGLQTERNETSDRDTQTETTGVTVREISELKCHEVSAGLYRMVKSKEAGKFYLYPEKSGEQKAEKPSKCHVPKGKKSKRTGFLNVSTKERRVVSKEKERAKLKKVKRTVPRKNSALRSLAKKKRLSATSDDSINCLYFRRPDKLSESLSSKKDLTDEAAKDPSCCEESAADEKKNHLACFWFWNGKKITPGCDLKTHVENIVKEKLTEMTHVEGQQNEQGAVATPRDASGKCLDEGEVNTIFFCSETKNRAEEVSLAFADSTNQEDVRDDAEGKRKGSCDSRKPLRFASQEKAMKNVGTQNTQSVTATPLRCTNSSRHRNPVRRKCTRRNIIIKPTPGRGMTLKKAEDIVRAIEEIKNIKLGLENPNIDASKEAEKAFGAGVAAPEAKRRVEERKSRTSGTRGGSEKKEVHCADLKNLEKLINLVDREVQTAQACERENSISLKKEVVGRNEHLELIESVLSGVSQRERERLWNGVRDFIKTKIGRDINDEGTREVCIEIEQHVPRTDQGNVRRSVLARGHYSKNDGDVEMEIDLTLDDLARILRQRHKKVRRRNLGRSSKSKSHISGSSIQSEFAKHELRKHQKSGRKYAIAEGDFSENKVSTEFRRTKPAERY